MNDLNIKKLNTAGQGIKTRVDITVSFDGSWQKRGYKSLYEIGVVIDLLISLVIDYEVLSKYCTECTAEVNDLSGDSPDFAIQCEGHKPECKINDSGSSSGMEMEAAAILWQRSNKESICVKLAYCRMEIRKHFNI
ncbi:uncharacterized protein TNCV_4672751 [Trichonephila clavipes]|nr:uncharacterized protein TNCV_4672751 [Trichonephila clavipes]